MTDPEQSISTEQAHEAPQDKRAQLNDLITRAAAKDATKDHNLASELYSQATEIQAELNGELSPENADLLYSYGKSLYNVAVSRSDVLGSKVAGEPQGEPSKPSGPIASSTGSAQTGENLVKDAISKGMAKDSTSAKEETTRPEETQSKPFFQFTGDENFVDSDSDEEDGGEAGDEEEEDEDDFANAFEVLDLARILYIKKLEMTEDNSDTKGKSTELPGDIKHIKERLADTHDLQAEISLEAERFSDAVADLRTALDMRYSLFPFEDPSVAECHYKLSLALEFASIQQQDDENDEGPKTVDEEMRKEAATQMERAIESCRVRMDQEEKKLANEKDMDEDKVTATKRKIANVKEIVGDMEQRLVDLRRAPVSVEQEDQSNEAMLKGILGQIVGQSATDKKAQLDAANQQATDLSSLVRRKPASTPATSSAGKRPATDDDSEETDSKRARVDDAPSAS